MESECCASGRCEVCSPMESGWGTYATRTESGILLQPFCMTCGEGIHGTPYQRLPWGEYCSWECADDGR